MLKQYDSPNVEILYFLALENLAANPEAVEANREQRSGSAGGDGGDVGNPSFGEGVEEW